MSCPRCFRNFSIKEIVKILEGAGVPKKTIKTVKDELSNKVDDALEP
jgi:hypothetical protein